MAVLCRVPSAIPQHADDLRMAAHRRGRASKMFGHRRRVSPVGHDEDIERARGSGVHLAGEGVGSVPKRPLQNSDGAWRLGFVCAHEPTGEQFECHVALVEADG